MVRSSLGIQSGFLQKFYAMPAIVAASEVCMYVGPSHPVPTNPQTQLRTYDIYKYNTNPTKHDLSVTALYEY